MKHDELLRLFDEFAQKQKEILIKKNEDYNGGLDDRLACFKAAGTSAGYNAQCNVINLIATKTTRLGSLLKGEIHNYESISDNTIDLANYSFFLFAIENEKK